MNATTGVFAVEITGIGALVHSHRRHPQLEPGAPARELTWLIVEPPHIGGTAMTVPDGVLLTRATEILTRVVTATTRPTGIEDDARTSTALHTMAAVAHLRLGGAPAEPTFLLRPYEVAGTASAVERALRDALHQLVQLTPATFDTDPVLDAVTEIQAALAATG